MARVPIAVGGTAVVCCVHDRVKREVPNPDVALKLAQEVGIEIPPGRYVFLMCACCKNVFVKTDDTPSFCDVCSRASVHALGGPLPAPSGAI